MLTNMRQSGIDVIGGMPWGTHFCLFYETKSDLLETLTPYFKAGLENHEFCSWVVAAPVTEDEARRALRLRVEDLDRCEAEGRIEIVPAREWYLQDGVFDLHRVIRGWQEKLARALSRGYAGIRVTGDTVWLEKKDWKDFCEYEESLNDAFASQRVSALCTYPLSGCGAAEVLDVVRTHQFAIARRHGNWDVIETAGYKQAKAEIKRLNDELEQRVVERTEQLMRAETQAQAERERLRQVRADLAHVSRVTALGELAASLAHEIKQPIAAASTDADTCLRWLRRGDPDLAEARDAASRVVKGVNRAAEIITSLSGLFNKRDVAREAVDVNALIREMAVLVRSEGNLYSITIRTVLTPGLPPVIADPVQLQQVLMNLMLNGIDAMKHTDRGGELTIASEQAAPDQLLISVTDTGIGVAKEQATQIFDAFFTTKPHGIGMGLPISRSIVESHGGRLWVDSDAGAGASFRFVLPAATG
jgi:C4-dicarboxylate-specific signal transduction histidine kinase